MNISSFNQNWIFQNKIKNKAGKRVNLPHDAMLTEKRLAEGRTGAACAFFPGGSYIYRKNLFGAEEYNDRTVLFSMMKKWVAGFMGILDFMWI